jgi:hypothetical protein
MKDFADEQPRVLISRADDRGKFVESCIDDPSELPKDADAVHQQQLDILIGELLDEKRSVGIK